MINLANQTIRVKTMNTTKDETLTLTVEQTIHMLMRLGNDEFNRLSALQDRVLALEQKVYGDEQIK